MPSPDSPRAAPHDRPPAATTPPDRQQLTRLVRRAASECYGVARLRGSGWLIGILGRLGRSTPGVIVATAPRLRVEIDLEVVPSVPADEVARNVEKAVRYLVQRDTGHAIDELVIHVDGARVSPPARRGEPRTHG